MRRTTVLLPDDLATLLDQERRRRDVSTAEVIREALTRYLAGDNQRHGFGFLGVGRSGQSGARPGLAERAEEILASEWTRDTLAGNGDR